MVVKVFERDGIQYRYEAEDFTTEGVRWSNMFPHDPVLLEELGLQTKGDVLKYWIENRGTLGVRTWAIAYNMQYFTERSPEECESLGIRALSRYLVSTDPALVVLAPDGVAQTSFLLDIPEENHPYQYSSLGYGGTMYFIASNPNPENVWSRHWNYSYKMDQFETNWFRTTKKDGKDPIMLGLELEVNTKLHLSEIQKIVTDVEPKQEPFFIFKQDGSISGQFRNCYELVTVPCTPRYLRQEFKKFFKKLEKLCTAEGLSVSDVFDTSCGLSNGLHIHVGKESFVSTGHEKRFMAAWNMQDEASSKFFQALSKRPHDYKSNSYCCPSDEGRMALSYRLTKASWLHRGVCHSRNRSTREVRIFQGLFDLNHILRCIDTVEAMVDFTNMCSLRLLVGHKYRPSSFAQTFKDFVLGTQGYANLKEEIKCA